MKKILLLSAILPFSLSSFASSFDDLVKSVDLNETVEIDVYDLKDLSASKLKKLQKNQQFNKVSNMRAEALKDIALRLGTSAGLANQFKAVYQDKLKSMSAELDRIYNFEALKISPGVLPPVLTQSFSNYEKKNDDLIQIADKTYSIESPAKMVSVYPTWRDYLNFNFRPAELPEANFMPKTSQEKKLWDVYVAKGWEIGVGQAVEVWNDSFATLNRDYQGMILYKKLLMENAITPTIVASSNLGVTGDGKTMSVNQKVVKITDHSEFQRNQTKWKNKYPATYKAKNGKLY